MVECSSGKIDPKTLPKVGRDTSLVGLGYDWAVTIDSGVPRSAAATGPEPLGAELAERLTVARMPDGSPEVFATIQGEGASQGVPSTFLRLAVCNLRCSWCDTAYTWDWKRYARAEQTRTASAGELVASIAALAPRNVVITGGEPLIQRRQLVPLARELVALGRRIEVETNGSIAPGPLAEFVAQFNVSPKLLSSGNEGLRTIRPEVLRAFADPSVNAFAKFVVSNPEDVDEVDTIVREAGFQPEHVILMPQGTTAAELNERGRWLANACVARGYRFSTRLHIFLWGDKRGV